MRPVMVNWAGSKGGWVGGITWKTIDGINRSMPGYHEILFSSIYVGKYPP